MFEGKELKDAKKSALQKHELYVEMRQMYVELAKAYVKIRKKVDAMFLDCPAERLMEEYMKLYLDGDLVSVPYSMPVLLRDGHILSLQASWTDPFYRSGGDYAQGIYIDNDPVYLWNSGSRHFSGDSGEKYYDAETVENQRQWDEYLSKFTREMDGLRDQLRKTNPLRITKRNKLAEQLRTLKTAYEEERVKAAGWFQNGMNADEAGAVLFSQHGIRRKKGAADFSSKTHKMEADALPVRKPSGLSEDEETAYWRTYEAKLDREIQNIRSYTPAEDDVYMDYEACANGMDRAQVLENCHNDVALYRFWLSASYVVYFKQLVEEREAYRYRQAEYRQNRARFMANLMSFGEYTVEDGYVVGTNPYGIADMMSSRYGSIERRRNKAFNSDVKELNEKWERFGLE